VRAPEKSSRQRRSGRAAGGRWAVVTVAALDLRKRPNHRSELGSQLLAGEVAQVERRSVDGLWWRVRGPDGYPGWARAWGLALSSEAEASRWRRRATARVRVPYTVVRGGPGRGAILSPAYLHSRFAPLETRGAWREVVLPAGGRGWIERRHLALGRAPRSTLRQRVERLLGTPYLWGGRTAMGLDCSGFVQMITMEDGARLPRDAHDQWLATKRLSRSRPRAGDLVFFGSRRGRVGHVGILLDRATYAHARGSVRLNSLIHGNQRYDKELGDTVRGYGRLPRRSS
jgi:gamma-D-glutamyl-L-lysine dipeptidyl-peptidase